MQGFATIHSMSISMYLALCLLEMVASKTAAASPASRLLVQHPLLPGNLVKASEGDLPPAGVEPLVVDCGTCMDLLS